MSDLKQFSKLVDDIWEMVFGTTRRTVSEWKDEPDNHDFSYPIGESKFKQGEIVYGESRPGEVKRFISNSDKMKSFGWKPKVDLEEGLKKYINWRKSL